MKHALEERRLTEVSEYAEIIHCRLAAGIFRSWPIAGSATAIAGPLPMLFIIASVHAAMIPAVLRPVILRGVECAVVS